MNVLRLGSVPFEYDNSTIEIGEFYIDDKPLCEWFGVTRHLANCRTNIDKDRKLSHIEHFLAQLTGDIAPFNQYGTPRVVLYGCFCGSDYCGIDSCQIMIGDNSIKWQHVTCESEDYDNTPLIGQYYDEDGLVSALSFDFEFDKSQYLSEIERYQCECQSLLN